MPPEALEELARRAAASVDGDALVALTRALVRIDSVVRPGEPSGNETRVAEYLAGELRRRSLDVRVDEVVPGRPNVVADWRTGRPGRALLLEGHTDVVTEGDPAAWTYPPFDAALVNGRIYGRGANDMKGGLAAAIAALDAVRTVVPGVEERESRRDTGAPRTPDAAAVDARVGGRVRIAAVCDEEGMMQGIKAFIRAGHAAGFDGAIVCEPEQNEVCLHQKGAIRAVATFHGRMAHGAMPFAGVNPIPAAARFVAAVAALNDSEQARHGAHPLLGRPWITPTTVRAPATGEAQLNVMAGDAVVTIDVRTLPGQDHAELRSALTAAARASAETDERVSAELEIVDDRPWTETPADHPLVRAAAGAQTLVLGGAPRFGGVPGTTDGTFLHAWANVPIVTMGPGRREVPHQANEYLDVEELLDAARIYAAAIVLFLGEET
jgi:succinyl-diaminopimelate desuccinylase